VLTGDKDYVCYVGSSSDNRFVIAGIQNSLDSNALFVVWHLLGGGGVDSNDATIVTLNASVGATVVLGTQEAVTGTRDGQLVVWSLSTGNIVRCLLVHPSSSLVRSPGAVGGLGKGGSGFLERGEPAHRAQVQIVHYF